MAHTLLLAWLEKVCKSWFLKQRNSLGRLKLHCSCCLRCLQVFAFVSYHVGESQLASLRHFLRFIDLEKEFEEYGFNKKVLIHQL